MTPSDHLLDFRAQAERRRLEAEERRDQSLLDLRSPDNSPELRIRVWERLHQLRLPRNPAHAILAAIARQTGLALEQVLEVQRQRAAPPA